MARRWRRTLVVASLFPRTFSFKIAPVQSIWDRANPQLRDLAVYQPGKPIEETARELGCEPSEIIKLASNENPLGPSPKSIEAISDAIENAQLYPVGGALYFRNAISLKLTYMTIKILL